MPRNQGNPLLNALGINVNLKHHHSIKYKFSDDSVEVVRYPSLRGSGMGPLYPRCRNSIPGEGEGEREEGSQRLS